MLGPLARISHVQSHDSSSLEQEVPSIVAASRRQGLTFDQQTAKLPLVSDLRERLQATLGSAYAIQRELGPHIVPLHSAEGRRPTTE